MEENRGEVFSKKKAMGQKRLLGCATPGLKNYSLAPRGCEAHRGTNFAKLEISGAKGALGYYCLFLPPGTFQPGNRHHHAPSPYPIDMLIACISRLGPG